MVENDCPKCGSMRTRRGGAVVWAVYLLLIGAAVPMVLIWHFDAALVALTMLVTVALAHLIVSQRICLDCGQQWRRNDKSDK